MFTFCTSSTNNVTQRQYLSRTLALLGVYPPTTTGMALLLPTPPRSLLSYNRPGARPTFRRRASLSSATTTAPAMAVPATGKANWVKATAGFFENDSRPIMLFDGVCNLCNGGVKFVRDHDAQRQIRFEPLQSESGKKLLQRSGRAPDDISSVVLVDKERSYIKSEAVLKIMEYLDLPFPQLAFFLKLAPLFLRDFAYDNVANNRYTIFGYSDTCEI